MSASEFAFGEDYPGTFNDLNPEPEVRYDSLSGELGQDMPGGEVPVNKIELPRRRFAAWAGTDQAIDNVVEPPSPEEIDRRDAEEAARREENKRLRETLTRLALGADYFMNR